MTGLCQILASDAHIKEVFDGLRQVWCRNLGLVLRESLENVCAEAMDGKEFPKLGVRNTHVLSVFFDYPIGCVFFPL